jgi:hypothetical protein
MLSPRTLYRTPNARQVTTSQDALVGCCWREKACKAKLFPTAAIRYFVRHPSIVEMYCLEDPKLDSTKKAGVFADAQSTTQMTERIPCILKPFVRKFSKYNKHPLSLSISYFCKYSEDGQE